MLQNRSNLGWCFPADLIGDDGMIIVAFQGDHTMFVQRFQTGCGRVGTRRIANIAEMVDEPAVPALEAIESGPDGFRLTVAVGHNSDQNRHFINTPDLRNRFFFPIIQLVRDHLL
jgi:hypothetical protein